MIDFHACQWPNGLNSADDSLADYFDALNEPAFSKALQARGRGGEGAARVHGCASRGEQREESAGGVPSVARSLPPPGRCLPSSPCVLQGIEEETDAAGGKRPPIISFSHFLPRQELLPEKVGEEAGRFAGHAGAAPPGSY